MTICMRGCVAYSNLWPWPISSRSFSHDFAIKLLKYGTSCHVCSTTCTVPDVFFPYLAQMIISIRGCVTCSDLWPWPLYSRSFSHDFPIKLLKYGTYSHVRSAACTVLDGFFRFLAQMITSMRRSVAFNDLWPSPTSSRLFHCEIAYFMDDIHMWLKYNPGGDDVSCTISRSIDQKSKSNRSFTFLQLITDQQFLVIPPLHRSWNGGILDSPRCLSACLSVHLSVCRQGFRNFLKKLLAQFISYLAFTLMGWVSWPLFIFVFLASFLTLWWPNIWPKMGFPEVFEINNWPNSFHTWHLPLWGESLDPCTFSCS